MAAVIFALCIFFLGLDNVILLIFHINSEKDFSVFFRITVALSVLNP